MINSRSPCLLLSILNLQRIRLYRQLGDRCACTVPVFPFSSDSPVSRAGFPILCSHSTTAGSLIEASLRRIRWRRGKHNVFSLQKKEEKSVLGDINSNMPPLGLNHPFLDGCSNLPADKGEDIKMLRVWLEQQPHLPPLTG